MTVNQKLKNALGSLVSGNAWPDTCPKETPPDEYLVYYPLREAPAEFGDDNDTAWIHYMAVHWIKKGNVNYTTVRNELRKRLKQAGFTVTDIVPGYDDESKTTHVIVNCNIVEDGYNGTY